MSGCACGDPLCPSPRDPRLNPRPGDVLRKGNVYRTVQVGPSTSNICVRCHERLGDSCRTVRPFLSQFRRWAAGAEVLEGGDAPGRGSGRNKTLDKV